VFVSDLSNWWQPWRWRADGSIQRLCAEESEFHAPDWVLGQSSIAELDDGTIACRRRSHGIDSIGVLIEDRGQLAPIPQPCVSIGGVCAHAGGVAWLGSSPTTAGAPWWCAEPARSASCAPGATAPVPTALPDPILAASTVSVGEHFSFRASSGREVHGLFYSPSSDDVRPLPGERPPLITFCHGGPTGCAEAGFDPVIQLFTSRGYAVAAIDYAGSSGYGRAYRQSLWGEWGIADVDDCRQAALRLATEGRVDGSRMVIRGSSAGGFTALNSLVDADVYVAAVSWYGVTDLVALSAATHDFEAHYNDRLVGPLPEAVGEYRRRSPAERAGDIRGAVLLLQGLDDPVVPPAQAFAMAAALRARGIRCDCVTFATEGHGFRRADTVQAALAAELAFYEAVLEVGEPDRVDP
jgi:acetyl esterase/lipase